jgi:hypothetical protein
VPPGQDPTPDFLYHSGAVRDELLHQLFLLLLHMLSTYFEPLD